jgi:pyrrolysine biosynthesis protein PylC
VRVAVIGGKLQGVEAAYLARKAGWETLVVDRRPGVPASGLCDRFVQLNVSAEKHPESALGGVDLVIPALENRTALNALVQWGRENRIPVAFDTDAYNLSASKPDSDRLFSRLLIPAPLLWPECGFPVVVKPRAGSGSRGVRLFQDLRNLQAHIKMNHEQTRDMGVIQEFVPGPSYSLEIVGSPGLYTPLQVTELEMDAAFDCKRVLAPAALEQARVSEFEAISVVLAEALRLKGLMDVEVILNQGELKVLEIDARLPSQTPTAVYWSTKTNMLELLAEVFVDRSLTGGPASLSSASPPRGVVYEHVRVSTGLLETAGEHMMTLAGPLSLEKDFFGADEALTDYSPGRDGWVATLIISAETLAAALEKRNSVIEDIRRQLNLETVLDPSPPKITPCGGRLEEST